MTADPFGSGRSLTGDLDPGEQAVADRLAREAPGELAAQPTIVASVLDRLDRRPPVWHRVAPGLAVAASIGVIAVIAWRAGIALGPGGKPVITRPPVVAAAADRSTRTSAAVERASLALNESVQQPFRREAAAARDLGGTVARRFTGALSSRVRLLTPNSAAAVDGAGAGAVTDDAVPEHDEPGLLDGSTGRAAPPIIPAGSTVPAA